MQRGTSLYKGRAFNLDEAYEFWGHLDLTGKPRGDKDGAPSVHASSGKTRRATRSSTNFGESRGKPVSISINGNGHPEKFIPMDRGMTGSHTACTKERFLFFCLDHSTARHAALPAEMQLPEGDPAWTWLLLLPQHAEVFGWEAFFDDPNAAEASQLETADSQGNVGEYGLPIESVGPAGGYKLFFPDGNETRLRYLRTPHGLRTEFCISSRWRLPDPTDHIRDGARTVTKHFITKPNSVLPFEEEARKIMLGNQVVQSIRSQRCVHDSSVAALHATAAGQQGVSAGAMAGLDLAAGGAVMDPTTNLPMVTVEHVNFVRRLVDISVRIRDMWRRENEELIPLTDGNGDGSGENLLARAVRGNFDQAGFGAPVPTQRRSQHPTRQRLKVPVVLFSPKRLVPSSARPFRQLGHSTGGSAITRGLEEPGGRRPGPCARRRRGRGPSGSGCHSLVLRRTSPSVRIGCAGFG